jgi:glycerophosphoryl diester phosphodiesterase
MTRTAIAGHRGASALVRHENTVEAFLRAAEVGAGWVELDVRRLADGALVVFHDADLSGVPLRSLTLRGLRDRCANLGFCPPTLEEALAACRGRLSVDIELKEEHTEDDAAAITRAILPPGAYAWTSFHDGVVRRLATLDPDAPRGLLLGRPQPSRPVATRMSELYPMARLQAVKADFVAPNFRLLRLGFLRRMEQAGYPVWVWTVNEVGWMRHLLRAGVAMIITDHPDQAVQLRDIAQPVRPAITAWSA